ncbi:glycoside hydrolase [Paenibacillus swuensis]|uniref:Glycoside hydrolase n=1 Tax=Paenibacillus swuensis TaxID=1178515 RepID=A0A172TEC7_9BACL|nr:glycoside hydrolase family 31 protein [Paenibacillus swuensis]ANE45264.1 glycoside hydrolase [Paenibacillus swuensis]
MSNRTLVIPLLPGEYWWGGKAADGIDMPYSKDSVVHADLSVQLDGNQGSPLLLSNRGRVIWSEEPFAYEMEQGVITLTGSGDVRCTEELGDLREGFRYASKTYFPPSGTFPDEILFTAPQYNLWIELLYEPTQAKVLDYARNVLRHGYPPGVIMIDDNWHEPYGTWKFHSGRFPDPKAMCDELHEMGFKIMLWVCPLVSPDSMTFRQLERKGYLLKDAHGDTAIRKWWNGYSAVLDCTNKETSEWLRGQLDELMQTYGVDGFKLDAGDLDSYEPADKSAIPGTRNDQCEAWAKVGLHYPLNEYRACWKLAGQPLAQRLKDKHHQWGRNGLAHLISDGLAQGLLGYAFSCPDMIGGGEYLNFLENSDSLDQELIVRYAQCSALFPMMQFSAAPWRILDDEHQSYVLEAARLHERMDGEIMKWAEHAAVTGEPVIRHMSYMFPDAGYDEVKDQFMLGEDILVAPVLIKGGVEREIRFPEGRWTGEDGRVETGPCRKMVSAPIHRLPWYRRDR